MTRKPGIVAHLGEESLLLPRAALEAREAAERASALLDLLRRTRNDGGPVSLWPPTEVAAALGEQLAEMLVPLRMEDELRSATHARRLEALMRRGEGPEDDFHRLLADVRRELERILEEARVREVAGATTYRLEPQDLHRVERFMAGIARTGHLKFNHPGLNTSATRHGDRLVIQNDVGTTEVQVLVLHLEDQRITLTYTDLHRARAELFQRLLQPFPVHWQDVQRRPIAGLLEGDHYYLCTGVLEMAGSQEAVRFLEHLGSRLVFLIDWNKARKRLCRLLSKRAALDLLDQAAREGWGHRAFLELGGEDLVRQVLAEAGLEVEDGQPIHPVVGRNGARELMARVLATCTRRLAEGAGAEEVRGELVEAVRQRFGRRGPGSGRGDGPGQDPAERPASVASEPARKLDSVEA